MFNRLVLLIVSTTFLSLSCTAFAFAVDDEPAHPVTLEQLHAMATEWRAQFVNVHLVYDHYSLTEGDGPLLEDVPPVDASTVQKLFEVEWIWADHGLDYFDFQSFYELPGATGIRNLDIFNGPKNLSMRVHYQKPADAVEVMKELNIQVVATDKPTSSFMRSPMEGLYSPATCEWLPDLLQSKQWTVETVEDILGTKCAKIKTEDHGVTHWLWLDLQHGAVIRRSFRQSTTQLATDFVVDEIQQLDNGLWFPQRARVQIRYPSETDNQLIIVTSAQVNCSLDLSRFEPPVPEEGTVVTDGRPGRSFIQGDPHLAQSTDSTESGTFVAVPDASFAGRGMWKQWLAGLSITLLVIGFWFRRKSARR